MTSVVLDKSWIYAARAGAARLAAQMTVFLFPAALLYELLTTERDQQVRCMRHLAAAESNIWLLPPIGNLLRHESATRSPSGPVAQRALSRGIHIHPDAGTVGYSFNKAQLEAIATERRQTEGSELDDFKAVCASVAGWFPALRGLAPSSPHATIKPYLHQVSSNHDMVRDLYGSIRASTMPPAHLLDPRWAYFRWMQVRLAGALEYIRKYGDGAAQVASSKLPNFYIDQAYLIVALLSDGLASRDLEMCSIYRILAPRDILLQSSPAAHCCPTNSRTRW